MEVPAHLDGPVVHRQDDGPKTQIHGVDARMEPGAHIIQIPHFQSLGIGLQAPGDDHYGAGIHQLPEVFLVLRTLYPDVDLFVLLPEQSDHPAVPGVVPVVVGQGGDDPAGLMGGNGGAVLRRQAPEGGTAGVDHIINAHLPELALGIAVPDGVEPLPAQDRPVDESGHGGNIVAVIAPAHAQGQDIPVSAEVFRHFPVGKLLEMGGHQIGSADDLRPGLRQRGKLRRFRQGMGGQAQDLPLRHDLGQGDAAVVGDDAVAHVQGVR